jgi:hypothetical protein
VGEFLEDYVVHLMTQKIEATPQLWSPRNLARRELGGASCTQNLPDSASNSCLPTGSGKISFPVSLERPDEPEADLAIRSRREHALAHR